MRNLMRAAMLSLKISFMLVLAFWLLLAMGVELFPWTFFAWPSYCALFLFIGYNCYLWFISNDTDKEVVKNA
jgi:hypothetical protein